MITRKDLEQLICELYDIEKLTPLMTRQITKFVTELGLNYKDIARALVYFVEVDGGKIDLKFGIGIVPYTVDAARKYYEALKKQEQQQKEDLQKQLNEPNIILKQNNNNTTTTKT